MRILGFTEIWAKLQLHRFTTFRFKRRDRDWEVGEVVQIVFKPRSKNRKVLGIARITDKDQRSMWLGDKPGVTKVSNDEAVADGFLDNESMWDWMFDHHGDRVLTELVNKLTLEWVKPKRVIYMLDGKPQVAEVGGSPWGTEGDKAVDTGGETRLEVVKVLEWRETVSPLGEKA